MKNCSHILTFILQIFIINCVFSQSGEGIETLSLDGDWEVIFDDNNRGVSNKWYTNDNFNIHPSKQTVEVPSALESLIQNYEGVAFYRKQFKVPINWKNQVVEVHFEAANYKTEVWLNDEVVGFHEGGYTPFRFRIDKLLKVGKNNSLVVRIVTPIILTDKNVDGLGRQEVPMWRGAINGGLWQSVSLIKKNWAQLNDVFLETDLLKKAVDFNFEFLIPKLLMLMLPLKLKFSIKTTPKLYPKDTHFL
jgi:beta-galactosidase/beta-glucuronidase